MPGVLPRALAAPLAALLLLLPAAATGADWGGIVPGTTTRADVRARYGPPSKETRAKVDDHDTLEWVYEGPRAPGGFIRMSVDFGLLAGGQYKADLVRAMRLEPKPGIFGVATIVQAWGQPDRGGVQDGRPIAAYLSGLFITLDEQGEFATHMLFTPPQPEPDDVAPAPAPLPPTSPQPPRRR